MQFILGMCTVAFGILAVLTGTGWATERDGAAGRPRGDRESYLSGAIASMFLAGLSWIAFLFSLR